MSEVSASAVASLRSRTGVSILECKKALEEAGGDEEAAIEILRKRGVAQAAKKADREQHEGAVFIEEDEGVAGVVKLHCETDFVARDDGFIALGQDIANIAAKEGSDAATSAAEDKITDAVQKLGENITVGSIEVVKAPIVGSYVHGNRKIGVVVGLEEGESTKARDAAMHAAAMNPLHVKPEDVAAEDVEREKAIWKEQLESEGKPAEIMEKIMEGKEKKFREENALLTQEFVKEPGQTVGEYLGGGTVTEYVRVSV